MKHLDKIEFEPEKRHNLVGKHTHKEKTEYNMNEWFTNHSDLDIDDLAKKLGKFEELPYRHKYIAGK